MLFQVEGWLPDRQAFIAGVYVDKDNRITTAPPVLKSFRGLPLRSLVAAAKERGWTLKRLDTPPIQEVRLSDVETLKPPPLPENSDDG